MREGLAPFGVFMVFFQLRYCQLPRPALVVGERVTVAGLATN